MANTGPQTSGSSGYYNPYAKLAETSNLYNGGQAGQNATIGGQAGAGGAQDSQGKTFLGMSTDQAIGTGISALGGIAGAMNQKVTDPQDFSVDPWAGYTGSAQGFASGGPWGAIIGGAVAQLGTFNKVHSAMRDVNTGVNAVEYDAFGRPLYSGAGVTNAQRTSEALGKGVKAINSSVDPATHAISFIRGTERQLKRKQRRLKSGIQAGQATYNNQAAAFNQTQLGLDRYSQLMNRGNRLKSLYNIGNQGLY